MDSDEFDDGIADDDLLAVLDQPAAPAAAPPKNANDVRVVNGRGDQDGSAAAIALELEDIPSDAFSSPEPPSRTASVPNQPRTANPPPRTGLARTNSGVLRQTTLFGDELQFDGFGASQSQSAGNRSFRADLPSEEPTHHELDKEAMKTWVYPTNLGAIRDYQFSIVKNSLFNNTLVALPTGLGKTFIAATVMLNFHRWTKNAKIVFVAPTKPLVAQQIDACYNIAGIPRSETTLLTGDVSPQLRSCEWEERRVFFMTPQTLLNDISHGYADPKSIVLLVIDEAHRATGEYAYAKVAKLIRRFSKSIRVLALTATPGSKVETVQEVIDNLGISHCEIRTEESIDIRQYVHQRNIDQVVLDPSFEMSHVCELFSKALQPMLDKLSAQNIWYGRNAMSLTAFGLMQAQKEWFATRGRSANQGVQFMLRAIFSVLTGIAHSIKLLNFHGIKPFYDNLDDMRSEQESRGEKGSKYKRQLLEDKNFQEMMTSIEKWLRTDGFVGHPKLTALTDHVLNHFMDSGEGTRVIVFSEYRDSAEDIVRTLNKHRPLVKPSIFVGQADGKRGEGMKQAQQIQTIERFRKGEFNVLVATSIGEEGLDIGQVDMIICYDSSASPIRMLQRMGRTGRKRAGKIVLLLMRGREEEQFAKSKDSYEKMQQLICEGSRFNFRFDLSTRIIPRNIRPDVDKRHVHIPIENTQDPSLPEPKKRRAPAGKKKPPKKFHMPDGVETGFKKLSDYIKKPEAAETVETTPARNPELDDLATNPELSSIVLRDEELDELNRSYRDLPFNQDAVEEAAMPSLTAYPELQRQLRPVVKLKHGDLTKRCVKLLRKMGTGSGGLARERSARDTSNYREIPVKSFVGTDGEDSSTEPEGSAPRPRKRQRQGIPATTTAAAAARSSGRRTKITGRKQTIPTTNTYTSLAVRGDGDNELEQEEGLTRRIRKPKKAQDKHGKKQRDLQEVGDDCDRTSDLMMTDGSDMGSDLDDFIVSDNHEPSSARSHPAAPTSSQTMTLSQEEGSKPEAQEESYYVPTQLPATQEEEDSDDIPELEELVRAPSAIGGSLSGHRTAREPSGRATGRNRRQVLDSDSDE
ncbi:ATP-dependent DNA helicase MPH1 [Geosmithia morbida]|uniref:ATP-dependent DNA helicase n=1 Tax=Geosmithia morbida TaxID=1094350 RepID=A0A9P5D6X2_9HYPO|nr:ATP-dependent DNA helicase MPH1 [Geosmithia morbida]KAF4123949.1 ATP-dependent DNA helicase MPH1 [Geosmithia morbida]